MGELMHDALGIGLAATQVGVLHRLLVYRVEPDGPVIALVNPDDRVVQRGARRSIEEGCLSLPAVHVDVERPVHVRVRAQDEHGEQIVDRGRRASRRGSSSTRSTISTAC